MGEGVDITLSLAIAWWLFMLDKQFVIITEASRTTTSRRLPSPSLTHFARFDDVRTTTSQRKQICASAVFNLGSVVQGAVVRRERWFAFYVCDIVLRARQ